MKPMKPITKSRLLNIALYYLSRYDSSSEKLRQMLKRRVLRTKMSGTDVSDDADGWIEDVIAKVVADGYVDDDRYAQNIVRRYKEAGKSARFITQKLKIAGIDADWNDMTPFDELKAAERLVKKKKLGPFRPEETRRDFFKKDLAVLARAGFAFDIAIKALNVNEDNAEENNVF